MLKHLYRKPLLIALMEKILFIGVLQFSPVVVAWKMKCFTIGGSRVCEGCSGYFDTGGGSRVGLRYWEGEVGLYFIREEGCRLVALAPLMGVPIPVHR